MKLVVKPIQRGSDIVQFAISVVVLALTQASPAKIKTQHREAKTIQCLHSVKDHFVVQRAAIEGMRMADDGGVLGVSSSRIEQGFEAARRTIQKQGADCTGWRVHRVRLSIAAN